MSIIDRAERAALETTQIVPMLDTLIGHLNQEGTDEQVIALANAIQNKTLVALMASQAVVAGLVLEPGRIA
jgi:hypothetical protein